MMLESVLVFAAQNAGNPLNLFWGLIFMVLLGSIIIWVIGTLIFFIPAAIVAGVIWFLTGNPDYTGAAFLIIAALSILKKKVDARANVYAPVKDHYLQKLDHARKRK